MSEHIVLVAFGIEASNMKNAQVELMNDLNMGDAPQASQWWIAMDDRYDGSDNDTAIFVEDDLVDWCGVRAANVLHREGIHSFRELVHKTADELLEMRGMGPESFGRVIAALEARGSALREQ